MDGIQIHQSVWDEHQRTGRLLADGQAYRRNIDGGLSWCRDGEWVEVLFGHVDQALTALGFPRRIRIVPDVESLVKTVEFNGRLYRRVPDGIERFEKDRWLKVATLDRTTWGSWEYKIAALFTAVIEPIKPAPVVIDLNESLAPQFEQARVLAAISSDQRLAIISETLVTESRTENKVKAADENPSHVPSDSVKTVSVATYGRMCAKGLFIKLPDAAWNGWYRRTKTKIQYWSSGKTWLLSTHQDLACAALTAAGWPPDLEIESIGGRYVPAPLEGRWTRLYWRTVETVVLWARRCRWLFTGQSGAVQHRALAGR